MGEGLERTSIYAPKLSSGQSGGLEAEDHPGLHIYCWCCGGKCSHALLREYF